MKRLWFRLILATIASLLMGVLFYVALRRSYPEWTQLNSIDTAASIVVATLSGVAAWLFVQGVSGFKQEFRRAYFWLCMGILLFGLSQAQYPIASYLNLTFWYLDGFIALPYLAAAACIFGGCRALAKVLSIQTRWASWLVAATAALVAAGGTAILPHAPTDYSMQQIIFTNVLSVVNMVFLVFAIGTVVRIRQVIAQMYVHALQWLAVALGANVLAGAHYVLVNLLFARRDNWYFYDSVAMWGFLLGAILLVRAGYAMTLVGSRAATEQADGSAASVPVATELPIIDIIVYVAGLASKPEALDATLDMLRHVTARLEPGQRPSAEDTKALLTVYHKIETYLTTEEPLRSFTVPELRQMVSRTFNLSSQAAAKLWA